jgi:hypothetical protein
MGSSFFCVHTLEMKIFRFPVLCSGKHPTTQEVETGAAVHGSFDHLQSIDLSLDRTGAPGQGQSRMDGIAILTKALGKAFPDYAVSSADFGW